MSSTVGEATSFIATFDIILNFYGLTIMSEYLYTEVKTLIFYGILAINFIHYQGTS